MQAVTSGWHKNPMARALAAFMPVLGLLVPDRTTLRTSDDTFDPAWTIPMPLAEARPQHAPAGASTSCGSTRRELRFGWVDVSQDVKPPPRRGATACLAVYQPSDETRADEP
jgi:hypothetical protein